MSEDQGTQVARGVALAIGWCLVVTSGLAGFPARVWPCEPCAEEWGFAETARHADVVIIGRKVAEGPHSHFGQEPGGPQWIDVDVFQILKGDVESTPIRVKSWSAMCPYGIVIDETSYAMLLAKPDPQEGRTYYDAVNDGCAVKVYAIEKNTVQVDGQALSLEAFVSRLNQAGKTQSWQ